MVIRSTLLKLTVVIWLLCFAQVSFAQDTDCSPGSQDATCIQPIRHGVVPPPVCSTAAGWTTVTQAKWIGSGYTAPACNYQAPSACSTAAGWTTITPAVWNGSSWSAPNCSYQAPPTCPTGYTESTAPTWNGSGWVGLSCSPLPPQDVCPSGFSCDPNGVPYAMFLAYCGEISQTDILHVIHYQWRCTTNWSGASRVDQPSAGNIINSNGVFDYWNTSSSTTIGGVDTIYGSMTAPAGTTLQVTTIQWGQVLTTNGTNQIYTGYNAPDVSNESWYFACPNSFPNLNFSTVAAYGESNSTLIQCGP
jgi:hypothetical protein